MLKKIKLITIVLNFLNGLNNENTELKNSAPYFSNSLLQLKQLYEYASLNILSHLHSLHTCSVITFAIVITASLSGSGKPPSSAQHSISNENIR